jgi:hypothetical protein
MKALEKEVVVDGVESSDFYISAHVYLSDFPHTHTLVPVLKDVPAECFTICPDSTIIHYGHWSMI